MRPKFNKTKRNKALRQGYRLVKTQSWQGTEYFQIKNVNILEEYKQSKNDNRNITSLDDKVIDNVISNSAGLKFTKVEHQAPYGVDDYAYIIYGGEEQQGNIIVGGAVVNSSMYDFIKNVYPDTEVFIAEERIAPVIFKLNSKIVAILMPIRK